MTTMPDNALIQEYLQAMGIQSWRLKDAPFDEDIPEPVKDDTDLLQTVQSEQFVPIKPVSEPAKKKEQQQPLIQQESGDFTEEMEPVSSEPDIPAPSEYYSEPVQKAVSEPVQTEQTLAVPVETKTSDHGKPDRQEDTETEHFILDNDLEQKISGCQLCPGRSQRLNSLSGQGFPNAPVFFISDAPNAEEDRAGHYLTDTRGHLFHKMLTTIGIEQQYYYSGLVKCHSLQDFVVSDADAQQCSVFLEEQIQQLKPKLIVILGINPARILLKTTKTFKQLRGQLHSLNIAGQDYPALVSFHPDYLLRNPLDKKAALSDLLLIKQIIQSGSEA